MSATIDEEKEAGNVVAKDSKERSEKVRQKRGEDKGVEVSVGLSADELRSQRFMMEKDKVKYAGTRLRVKIALFVFAARKKAGLSQGDLAKAVGVSQVRISQIENPESADGPPLELLEKIAAACDVEIDLRMMPLPWAR